MTKTHLKYYLKYYTYIDKICMFGVEKYNYVSLIVSWIYLEYAIFLFLIL